MAKKTMRKGDVAIDKYYELQEEYEKIHGPKTIVLIEVGGFFECYEFDPCECVEDQHKKNNKGVILEEPIGKARELAMVLNFKVGNKNGSKEHSYYNPYMVGFPPVAFEKNTMLLLANEYTIVKVEQSDVAGQKTKSRNVAEILSPAMHVDCLSPTIVTSKIGCIYVQYMQNGVDESKEIKYENFLVTTGVAVIDMITGENWVSEFYSKFEDQIKPIQEIYRFLVSHNPKEIVLHLDDMPKGFDEHTDDKPNPYVRYLHNSLNLRRVPKVLSQVNKIKNQYKELPYQCEFFNKIFWNEKTNDSKVIQRNNSKIIEHLALDKYNYGRIAYMILLQHVYTYNKELLSKIPRPKMDWLDSKRHLILTHNAIDQLNLVSKNENKKIKSYDSLYSILDYNQTNLGKRMLLNLMQYPMRKKKEIAKYYDMVDEMLNVSVNNMPLWHYVSNNIKGITDISKLQRKLRIGNIKPRELSLLFRSYIKIISLLQGIFDSPAKKISETVISSEDIDDFNSFLQYYNSKIDFEILGTCKIEEVNDGTNQKSKWIEFENNPLRDSSDTNSEHLTSRFERLKTCEKELLDIVTHLNSKLGERAKKVDIIYKSAKKIKGVQQEPPSTYLTTSNASAKALAMQNIDKELCGNLSFESFTTSEKRVSSEKIVTLCSERDNCKNVLRHELYKYYIETIKEMSENYVFYDNLADCIAKIDLLHSYAKASHINNYTKPKILDKNDTDGSSFMRAQDLRHPIVEKINDSLYIPNDIYLGNSNDKNQDKHETTGMLLYGVNQTGKSTLAKAIALNIIMAQMGCYTPSTLEYIPYKNIITRLTGDDDMLSGKSSFAVEMAELRTILRQSDNRTLVIGDELSRGTESDSATSITISSILNLIKKGTSFIFTTHMHHVVKMPYISNLDPSLLRVCHLSVVEDPKYETLIYSRKLSEGPGSSFYGLLVAKYLDLPSDFLDLAYEILNYNSGFNDEILDTSSSNYNKNVFLDSCAKCSRTKIQTELHTHHIIEQNKADDKGIVEQFIKLSDGSLISLGKMHKNKKTNLISLCEECHQTLHKEKKELETLYTSYGTIIRWKSPA